jgi:hypothetical protein
MSAVETSIVYDGRNYPISFASDDSIDIVRQRIGGVLDRYPDRLFIQVEVDIPKRYYEDPRRWEAMFYRIAHSGNTASGKLLGVWTSGKLTIGVNRDDWDGSGMREWRSRTSDRFILGVAESQSLVLPIPPDAEVAGAVPPARIPLADMTRIFSSVHPHPVTRFHVTEITDSDSAIKSVYAPSLRVGTPDRIPLESINSLQKQFDHWKKLQGLTSPAPDHVNITRARWNVPWVRTEWPDAVRARFEEIMYGMTVSEDTPYIGLFMNREYSMQHKFWAVDRTPKLDLSMWGAWLQTTRPQRNRPTLLLYRGKDRSNFDRLAITTAGITATAYHSGRVSLERIQKDLLAWIKTLDALAPFIDQDDLQEWELQDISAELTYKSEFDANLLRLPCVSSIFVQSHPVYRLLRADKTDRSLSDVDVGILHSLRRNIAMTPEELSTTLNISVDEAGRKLDDIRERVEQDPSIMTQELDVMPKIEFTGTKVILQHAIDLDRVVKYTNILRYVLTGKGAELSSVCPARMEAVAPVSALAPTLAKTDEPEVEVDGDLADFLDQMGSARESKPDPLFKYYTNRLRKTDAETFDTPYSKKCEPSRQVLMMSAADQEKWKDTPYDVNAYPDSEKLAIPSGVTVCPDFWCMKDEIPLRKDQLVNNTCPVCRGKIRDPKSMEPVSEAPVVARDTQYKYPRFLDVPSSKNGQHMPCCYKNAKEARILAPSEGPTDPFYILGEIKKLPPLRLAYLPEDLARRLRLNIANYKSIRSDGNRLKDKATSVFRVGLGRPSKTLSTILGIDIPRPRDSIIKLFQCQFVRTWRTPREDDGTIATQLVPYIADAPARERMARLISGVDAAWEAGELSQIQELEYIALVTGTPMYRINVDTQTVSCGLWTQYFATGKNAIALLDTAGSIDLLAYANHKATMQWSANLYKAPFPENTIKTLRQSDGKACSTPFPTSQDALSAAMRIGVVKDTPVVVDPTGYGQALWAPQKYILPMKPDMVLQGNMRRIDYADMGDDQLPTYESQRSALEIASTVNPQFAWKRDIFDVAGRRVEIEILCGLRVPVVPEAIENAEEPAEVIQTIRKGRESDLVMGEPNVADTKRASEISYTAEVIDFLLFTLAGDLQKDENAELRTALLNTGKTLRPALLKWYTSVATNMAVDTPTSFVKKVRTPCGQFESQSKCKGICGWRNGKCMVRIDSKQVQQPSFTEPRKESIVFNRLYDELQNPKKRAVVLDGRASPFFSTILYLELPHERFLTDAQIKWEKTQASE